MRNCRRGGTLRLPFPPTQNHYWDLLNRPAKGARPCPLCKRTRMVPRKILSERAGIFRSMVALRCRMAQAHGARLSGPLEMRIIWHPPSHDTRGRRRGQVPDSDNPVKPLWDALEAAGVFVNDNQVCRYSVDRREPRREAEAIVTILEDPVRSPLDRDIGTGYL